MLEKQFTKLKKTYSGTGVLRVYYWAYIRPQAASHRLPNNNQSILPAYGCGAG